MAYSPTAAVAQASGRTSGERAMNATNVSSCSTVTAFPPARARTETRRPEEDEAPSGDPPVSPTVSLAPPSRASYLRPREPQSAEAGGDLPRPRRRRAGPHVRGLPGAEVRRRPAGLQGRGAGQPA